LSEIDRRRKRYMGDASPLPVADRTVIVVDDGIATGGTVRAALKALHGAGAARIVLALPVAPPDTIAELRRQCDDVVCLRQPRPFHAVGAHYLDFDQTSDDEVARVMQTARAA
jgi:putative phosphoribosyl transferase